MEQLMNQLVGASIARERERSLALGTEIGRRERRSGAADRRRPPRHRRGGTPSVAHA